MHAPEQEEIYAHLVNVISDWVLSYAESDAVTGRLLEEAVLEALESNASYFQTQSKRFNRLITEYKTLQNEKLKKDFKCFAECDI